MNRARFLIPSAAAAFAVATAIVVFDLGPTPLYLLVGVSGFFILLCGALRDLRIGPKSRVVVEMHEAAIGAEQSNCPEALNVGLRISEGDEERLLANDPIWVAARGARIQVLGLKKLYKRRVVTFSHWADPTQKSHV